MERNDLTDDLDVRLRAARPSAARVDEHAFDAALLARVQQQPIAARRVAVPRSVAMPIAAGVIVVATAAVVLGGIPGNVGGPSPASAITQQTLHWLDPAPGTVLHVRSVETSGTDTTTREYWQSADDPTVERELIEGSTTFESAGDAFYDPATNTIYDAYKAPSDGQLPADDPKAGGPKVGTVEQMPVGKPAEVKRADAARSTDKVPADDTLPAGDPIVTKVRTLLEDGRMTVTGRELHDGVDAWAISINPEAGEPVWTLWVTVADGKPLELRDPGRHADEPAQVIRWSTYEVLPDDSSTQPLLTLTGAHPSAEVTHDPARAAAAEQRLMVQIKP